MKKKQTVLGLMVLASMAVAPLVLAEETSSSTSSEPSSTSTSISTTSSNVEDTSLPSTMEPSTEPALSSFSTTDDGGSSTVEQPTDSSSSQIAQETGPTEPVIGEEVEEAALVEIPMYRLYQPANGEHLYTTDAREKDHLYQVGWGYEGIAWYSPSKGQAVYRLYNAGLQNHLYTTDPNEVHDLTTRYGWTIDNGGQPVFYSGGSVSIYRVYHPTLRGLHHWTTDAYEYNSLPGLGWLQEGTKIHALRLGNPVQTQYVYVEAFAGQFELTAGVQLPGAVKKQLVDTLIQFQNTGYHIGFFMMDMNTQRVIGYNANQIFYGASTIKGPFIASLAAMRPDLITPERNTMLSVLHYSSNEQYIRLASTYGLNNLAVWAQEAGVSPTLTSAYYPYLSTRELFQLWRRTYSYFTDVPQGQQIAEWFENPNYSPLKNVLGGRYRVRSKAGWIGEPGYHSASDAGIVYAETGPYVIAIMTDADARLDLLNPTVSILNTLVETLNQVQDEMAMVQ